MSGATRRRDDFINIHKYDTFYHLAMEIYQFLTPRRQLNISRIIE